MIVVVTKKRFLSILRKIASKETSSTPSRWVPKNPLLGHCAVASLLAQDLFGGVLLRASLHPYPAFREARSHYWNRFSDGSEYDFTKEQFGRRFSQGPGMKGEIKEREYLLSFPETERRYVLLRERFFSYCEKLS